jgi:hypothetical protein
LAFYTFNGIFIALRYMWLVKHTDFIITYREYCTSSLKSRWNVRSLDDNLMVSWVLDCHYNITLPWFSIFLFFMSWISDKKRSRNPISSDNYSSFNFVQNIEKRLSWNTRIFQMKIQLLLLKQTEWLTWYIYFVYCLYSRLKFSKSWIC